MSQIERRWQVAAKITPQAAENLSPYSPTFQQILFNRGIATLDEANTFLKTEYSFHDPYLLTGMQPALDRIIQAIDDKEPIVVYGDYDADGVTSTALMAQTLQAVGAIVSTYIPDRFKEGYGLNNEALQNLKDSGAKLIITVDCGIRAIEPCKFANDIGLEMIITDHHTVGEELPQAVAVINAKQEGDLYPEKNLAGVGMAFKLATALIEKTRPDNFGIVDIADLVAIGTVADMVPMIGENRALVRQGLHYIRSKTRQGLFSLLGVSRIEPKGVISSTIGFSIGPRINAAGRIASAKDALDLLLSKDVSETGQLAQTLDNHNRERQNITRTIQEEAENQAIAEGKDAFLLFAADPSFNPGVVGLAASRLVDTYYRPSIVGHQGEEFTRASCRSINEFHITEALEECADLLTHFGGHAAAAGFTVKNENLPELLNRLRDHAKRELDGLDLRPLIQADVEVKLIDLKPDLLKEMDLLQPTGYGNPEAVFVSKNVMVKSKRTVGADGAHLKLSVSDGKIYFDVIAFRLGHLLPVLTDRIDMIFTFEINEFQGRRSYQLNAKDIKIKDF